VPSATLDALVALFRNRPALAPELLRDALHVELPRYAEARTESADFSQAHAVEFRADLVVLLFDGKPVLAIVVEVQLDRDDDKLYSWPAYGALARSQFACPSVVLVFAPRQAVATWAHKPIAHGPGSVYQPLVVGPGAVPVVRDVEEARNAPELAVLSATAHGADPAVGAEVAFAAAVASAGLPEDRATLYWDQVLVSLNGATRAALEKMMSTGNYEYQSDFAKKYVAQGEAKGEAKALLRVLAARKLSITDEQQQRILACTDLGVLDRWLERAVTAPSTDDVLAD
jgi:hypothetical protein